MRRGCLAWMVVTAACGNLRGSLEPDSGPKPVNGGQDAGPLSDAGPASDAGPGNDAGPASDAGSGADAGLDAGVDAGVCDGTTCPDGCCAGNTCLRAADQSDAGCGPARGSCHPCPSAGSCSPNVGCVIGSGTLDMTWELDGAFLVDGGTFFAEYLSGQDEASVAAPAGGLNVQVFLHTASDAGSVSQACPWPFPNRALLVFTTVNGGGSPFDDALPPVWKGVTWSNCVGSSPDQILRYDLNSTVSTSHIAGSFDIAIDGGGPRAGSTLRAYGSYDVMLAPR